MMVKIDTREKFHVITINEEGLSANMTDKMDKVLLPLLETEVKNVIVNLVDTQSLDNAAAEHLLDLQHVFNDSGASFVVCELQAAVRQTLDKSGLLNKLNHTPTESEAMDIVHMEEIERDLGEI